MVLVPASPFGEYSSIWRSPTTLELEARLQRLKSFPVIRNQGSRGYRLAFGFFLGLGLGIADFRRTTRWGGNAEGWWGRVWASYFLKFPADSNVQPGLSASGLK